MAHTLLRSACACFSGSFGGSSVYFRIRSANSGPKSSCRAKWEDSMSDKENRSLNCR